MLLLLLNDRSTWGGSRAAQQLLQLVAQLWCVLTCLRGCHHHSTPKKGLLSALLSCSPATSSTSLLTWVGRRAGGLTQAEGVYGVKEEAHQHAMLARRRSAAQRSAAAYLLGGHLQVLPRLVLLEAGQLQRAGVEGDEASQAGSHTGIG